MALSSYINAIIPNLLTAGSIFPCVFPIWCALAAGDIITACCLIFVSVASVISHLWENHKHGMKSITPINKSTSIILCQIDKFAAICTIIRLIYLYVQIYGFDFSRLLSYPLMFLPFLFLFVSEYDKYNPKLKWMYLATHPIWHLTAFIAMDFFLKTFIGY